MVQLSVPAKRRQGAAMCWSFGVIRPVDKQFTTVDGINNEKWRETVRAVGSAYGF